jgi:hypothetical protein
MHSEGIFNPKFPIYGLFCPFEEQLLRRLSGDCVCKRLDVATLSFGITNVYCLKESQVSVLQNGGLEFHEILTPICINRAHFLIDYRRICRRR